MYKTETKIVFYNSFCNFSSLAIHLPIHKFMRFFYTKYYTKIDLCFRTHKTVYKKAAYFRICLCLSVRDEKLQNGIKELNFSFPFCTPLVKPKLYLCLQLHLQLQTSASNFKLQTSNLNCKIQLQTSYFNLKSQTSD